MQTFVHTAARSCLKMNNIICISQISIFLDKKEEKGKINTKEEVANDLVQHILLEFPNKGTMGIAHFLLLLSYYTALALFPTRLPDSS